MQIVKTLTYVGKRENAYDFVDRENPERRIKGIQRTAFFADESQDYEVHDVDVRDDTADLYGALKFGERYRVTTEPWARNNRVSYRLVDISDAATK